MNKQDLTETTEILYKEFERKEPLRFDLLIDKCLLVEVKAIETVHPINKAQLPSYVKPLDIPLGLILKFNVLKLADGISRLILPGANLNCVREADRGNGELALISLRFLLFKMPSRHSLKCRSYFEPFLRRLGSAISLPKAKFLNCIIFSEGG